MIASRSRVVAIVITLATLPVAVVAGALLFSGAPRLPSLETTLTVDLGRVLCGDCCIGKVWRAIGADPGVRDIDARAGTSTFVVHYDATSTQPARLLAELVAAGEATARLLPADPSLPVKHWVRTTGALKAINAPPRDSR